MLSADDPLLGDHCNHESSPLPLASRKSSAFYAGANAPAGSTLPDLSQNRTHTHFYGRARVHHLITAPGSEPLVQLENVESCTLLHGA